MAGQRFVPFSLLAWGHAALEDADAAFELFGRALEQRESHLTLLEVEPALDGLRLALDGMTKKPEIRIIEAYYDNPLYIQALISSIQTHWMHDGEPERILFSYHGIPTRYVRNGDPYPDQCLYTTQKIVQALKLADGR